MPIITPRDDDDAAELARTLLEAAGDEPDRVRTHSMGPRLSFEVDDELAAAVGRTPDQDAAQQGSQIGLADQGGGGIPGFEGTDQTLGQQAAAVSDPADTTDTGGHLEVPGTEESDANPDSDQDAGVDTSSRKKK